MKKTILHVLNTGTFSGAENVAITIINSIRTYSNKNSYRFIYVSLNGDISERLKKEGIEYEAIEKLSIKEMGRVIAKYHPDIIHAHDFTASIVCACASRKIPVISHIHNNSPWLKKICKNSIVYAMSCLKYRMILGVSKSVFEEFIFGKFFRRKQKVIGNPIDINVVRKKAEKSTDKESYDIVSVGRLSCQKNPFMFIDIVNEIKKKYPLKVAMIGDGEMKDDVKKYIRELQLEDTIELKGFMENPYGILKASKVLCMPSLWEGFGLVAVEALALGTPVVATEVGGLKEIVNSSCGKICNSKQEFVSEINKLLFDTEYYNFKAQGALERAEEINNILDYTKNIIQYYNM